MIINQNSRLRIITSIILVIFFWALFFYFPPIIFSIVIAILMSIMMIELKHICSSMLRFILLVPFYPTIPCLVIIYFNQLVMYKNLLLYLFVTVFSFDTASYLIGNLCNRFWTTLKMVPSISPGKSWEGFFGGYIITTCILFFTIKNKQNFLHWQIYTISACICIIAFAGDLFESYLKRSANIKDSGTLLPGHGGLLDRFDSILAVSLFFFSYKNHLLILLQ